MPEPSEELVSQLTALGLCGPNAWKACVPTVNRLTAGLPAFDSVWLDAFCTEAFLTPWQVKILCSESPDFLRWGHYLLQGRLGRRTFLAVDTEVGRRVVLKSSIVLRDPPARRSGRSPAPASADSRTTAPRAERSSTAAASDPVTDIVHQPVETDVAVAAVPHGFQDLITTLQEQAGPRSTSLLLPQAAIPLPVHAADLAARGPAVPTDAREGSANGRGDPGRSFFVVQPYGSGWSMRALLVRGGRFPWEAVAEMGRDLLQDLEWLNDVGLVHGELTPDHVILSSTGRIRLSTPLLRRRLSAPGAYRLGMTLKDTEGLSPEQAGTNRSGDIRSDLYACGCLLWELLTGRSPFLTTDPIRRLLMMKETPLPDVRELAPDCPAELADVIAGLTHRAPELRVSGPSEVLPPLQRLRGNSNTFAAGVSAEMPPQPALPAIRQPTRHSADGRLVSPMRVSVVAVFAMAIVGLSAGGLLPLPQTLTLDRFVTGPPDTPPETAAEPSHPEPEGSDREVRDMPEPDELGRILLIGGNRYRPTPVSHTGILTITASGNEPAVIVGESTGPWTLKAESVVLNNLQLQCRRTKTGESGAPAAGVVINTDSLFLESCLGTNTSSAELSGVILWQPEDASDAECSAQDCVFAGAGYAIILDGLPRQMQLSNVLLLNRSGGLRAIFDPADSRSGSTLPESRPVVSRLGLHRLTLRNGRSLVDISLSDVQERVPGISLDLVCSESVVVPRSAVIRLAAGRLATDQSPESLLRVRFSPAERGNPLLVPPNRPSVLIHDARLRALTIPPPEWVQDSGILAAEPQFADTSGENLRYAQHATIDFEGPKLTTRMPGILPSRLPFPSDGAP